MSEPVKTSPDDFELFKSECQKWIEYFGMKGWSIYFEANAANGNMAETRIGPLTDRCAVFCFQGSTDPNFHDPKRSAFHEVCELLLFRLHDLAEARYVEEPDIHEAVHEIIRVLENTIYKEKLI